MAHCHVTAVVDEPSALDSGVVLELRTDSAVVLDAHAGALPPGRSGAESRARSRGGRPEQPQARPANQRACRRRQTQARRAPERPERRVTCPALLALPSSQAPRNVAFLPRGTKGVALHHRRPSTCSPRPPSIDSSRPALASARSVRSLECACPRRRSHLLPGERTSTGGSSHDPLSPPLRARHFQAPSLCADCGLTRRWPLLHPSPSAGDPCPALSRRPPSELDLPRLRLPRPDFSRRTDRLPPQNLKHRRRPPLLR